MIARNLFVLLFDRWAHPDAPLIRPNFFLQVFLLLHFFSNLLIHQIKLRPKLLDGKWFSGRRSYRRTGRLVLGAIRRRGTSRRLRLISSCLGGGRSRVASRDGISVLRDFLLQLFDLSFQSFYVGPIIAVLRPHL